MRRLQRTKVHYATKEIRHRHMPASLDGPYNKTGYQLEHREDGFAITVGLMEYISGWP